MKKQTFLVVLILTLVLAACGDGGGGGGVATKKEIYDPWKGIGAVLPENSEAGYRLLEFSDGLGISYDERTGDAVGNDLGPGDEQVCRRENRDEEIFEVCMLLEDDPYFIALENNAIVWHPFMFERFATELSCYIYMEGEVREEEDCLADVFPQMGGEDFLCEAGLIHGDKALKCSDGWAVLVNGGDDDTKSVCRVHIESGIGRCLDAPKQGVADADLVLSMQRTTWDGYRSGQDNSGQFGVGETAQALVPQDIPAGATLTYLSHDPDICGVDDDDSDGGKGAVTIDENASAPEVCKISLHVEAEGFADRLLFVEIPILKANDTQWPDYIRSNNYFYPGEVLDAEPVSSSDPSVTANEYKSLDEEICTVDESTGTVTAVAAGECVIRLIAKAVDYLDVVIDRTIPVNEPMEVIEDITWSAFDGLDGIVGAQIPALAPPVAKKSNDVDYAAVSFSYEAAGDCSIDNNRVIAFSDATECVITVTASPHERSEAAFSKDFQYTPGVGVLQLAWTGYGSGANAAEYGASAPALDAPVALAGTEYSYAAQGGGCQVDAQTGALTIVGATEGTNLTCEVTVTAARSGYEDQSHANVVAIAKKPQADLTVEDPYGTTVGRITLKQGGSIDIVSPPSGGIGEVRYGYSGSYCTVDPATGSVTTQSHSNSCQITAYWTGDDNNAPSADTVVIETIYLVQSAWDGPTWSVRSDAPNPTVGGAPAIPVIAEHIDLERLDYRSKTPDYCSVSSTGYVTGLAAGDGVCILEARTAGGTRNEASDWENSPPITIDKGTQTIGGSDFYGENPTLPKDETLELVDPPQGFGAVTYSVKSGSESYCEVDGASGIVTGIAPGDCIVQVAFAGDDNYNALDATDLQTIAVTEWNQTIVAENPYGEDTTMAVGGMLDILNAPTAVIQDNDGNEIAGGAITYLVAEASSGICTVDNGAGNEGTITADAPGECTIIVRAASVDAVENGNPAYNQTTQEIATITVETGRFSFSWNPYPSDADFRAGGEGKIARVNVGSTGANVTYSVVNAGDTGCRFKGNSGEEAVTLVFDAYGVCTLRATATKEHYEDWSVERSIRVRPGKITVTVGQFGHSDVLVVSGDNQTPAAYSDLSPADAEIAWRLVRGEKDCQLIDEATGEVAARAVAIDPMDPPYCSLQLVARKTNYDTFRSVVVEIPLERGVLRDNLLQAPIYGSGANKLLFDSAADPKEGHIDMTRAPSTGFAAYDAARGLTVEGFAVNGFESNGSTAKADVCSVQNDGRVSVGSAATAGDKCQVVVTMKAVGYAPKAAPAVMLTLVDGRIDWGNTDPGSAIPFEGELKLASENVFDMSELPTLDGTFITWEYRGNEVCEVTPNQDGSEVTVRVGHQRVDVGDTCVVRAIAQVEGLAESVFERRLTLIEGDLVFADDSDRKLLYRFREIRAGVLGMPAAGPSYDDHDVEVTWGRWRVDGNACTVDSEGNVLLGAGEPSDVCRIYAVASADKFNDTEELLVGTLTVMAPAELGVLSAPGYSQPLAIRGLPVPVATAPSVSGSGTGVNITWTYAAVGKRGGVETEDLCSIDEETGTVAPGSSLAVGDTCEVVATASAPGYVSKDADGVALAAHDTFSALTWANFPTSAAVGTAIDLSSNQPVSVPVADSYNIAASGNCTYANESLSFSDATLCTVKVTAVKSNYLDYSETFYLTPGAGTIAATFGSYSTVKVGATTSAATVTITHPSGGTGVATTYSLASGSSGCTLATDGAVTGTAVGTGNCKVTVALTATGYDTKEHTYTMDVARGDIVVASWGTYGSLKVGTTLAAPTINISSPGSGVTIAFDQAGLTSPGCTVANNGRLTGDAHQVCLVRATLTATGYNTKTQQYTVPTALGDQTLTWATPYTETSVAVGDTVSPNSPPDNPISAGGSLQYRIKPDSTANCSIDGSGVVTPKGAGVGSNCVVQVRYASNANYNPSGWVEDTIAISSGTIQVAGNDAAEKWGGSYAAVVVGAATSAPTINTITPNTAAKSYTTNDTTKCTVDSNGAVTGVATGTNNCQVTVTLTATGYTNLSYTYPNISVGVGTQSGYTWTQPVNTTLAFNIAYDVKALTGLPGGATASYHVVTGDTNTAGCTLNGRRLSRSNNGSCKVFVRVTRPGYDNWDSSHRRVTISPITLPSNVNWNNFTNRNGRVRDNLTVPYPSNTNAAEVTLSESGAGCSLSGQTLSFTTTADCPVRAVVRRNGYNDKTLDQTVTVAKGAQIDFLDGRINRWTDPYGSDASLIADGSDNLPAPTGGESSAASPRGNARLEYQKRPSSTSDCTVARNGAVTAGTTAGSCIIQIRFRETANYEASPNWKNLVTITVEPATITGVSWAPQSAGTVGTDLVLDAVAGTVGGDTVTYTKIAGGCSVDSSTRTASFTHTYDCVVKASVERSGYDTWHSDLYVIRVTASSAMSFSSTRILTHGGFPGDDNGRGTGPLGFGAGALSTPNADSISSRSDAGTTVTTTLSVVGIDSDSSPKENVCTIDGNGAISAGSAAALGDRCLLMAAAVDSGGTYTSYMEWFGTLTVTNPQAAPDTNVGTAGVAYGSPSALAAGSGYASITAAPSGGGAVGGLEYQDMAGVCTVQNSGGLVQVPGGQAAGATCTIQARWRGDADHPPSAVGDDLGVCDPVTATTRGYSTGSRHFGPTTFGDPKCSLHPTGRIQRIFGLFSARSFGRHFFYL